MNIITANKVGASEEEIIKANIQKVKDCIYIILENYQTLNERRFLPEKIKDIKGIFGEIKKTSFLKDFVINNYIPFRWFLSSFFEYLQKLPEKYIDNDYDLLFSEIEKDAKDSIAFLNFEFLSQFQEKLNFSKKNLNNYQSSREKLNTMILNGAIKNIIGKEITPISFHFDYNNKNFDIKILKIVRPELLQQDIKLVEEKNKKYYICKTIKAFITAFPNLVKYESLLDEDLLELLKVLNIPEKINIYFNVIKAYLFNYFHKKDNFDYAEEMIYDFIMARIYDKIFPHTDNYKDDKIYRQTVLFSWLEPKHLIKENKIFNLSDISRDFHYYITRLQEKKSPFEKFEYLSKIFKLINKSAKFHGHELKGNDDTMPILLYLVLKEKPLKLYSNCKYMELFLLDKKNKEEDSQLMQFNSICDLISKMEYEDLFNVSLKEYKLKCAEALKNDK